jgi:hypothetical protein
LHDLKGFLWNDPKQLTTNFSAIVNANIFPVTKRQIQTISIAFSVTVRYMRSAKNAEGSFVTSQAASKTAQIVHFRTRGKITKLLLDDTRISLN